MRERDQSVPGQGHSFREKDHLLVDAGCEVADVEALLALDLRAHQYHNRVCSGESAEVERSADVSLALPPTL